MITYVFTNAEYRPCFNYCRLIGHFGLFKIRKSMVNNLILELNLNYIYPKWLSLKSSYNIIMSFYLRFWTPFVILVFFVFLCFTFFELESLRFNFGIKSWSNPNFKNWLSLKSTYTFLFKALNSFCYSCLFAVFCAYLEEWRRQKHIKKRIQDNHYLFKGGNMRMASDEDYGHVARKHKSLGI